MDDPRLICTAIWNAGVDAVRGNSSVQKVLGSNNIPPPTRIISVGKAAASMAAAAAQEFGTNIPMLVVTKYDHLKGCPENAVVIEAAHPVPDENSIKAGTTILQAVSDLGSNDHLLFLVSGGASSLAEVPNEGLSLTDIVRENKRLLASGLDIHAMNAQRRMYSQIKGGQLLAKSKAGRITVLAISDVEGDDIAAIGSGIGDCRDCISDWGVTIAASNEIARAAAQAMAVKIDLPVQTNEESLYDDVEAVALQIGKQLGTGTKGVYIWGGEPTVKLPENPGNGGRNQALSLLISREIAGLDCITVLVAGTDGTDGPTAAAGGLIDGNIWGEGAQSAIDRADSGTYLAERNALFESGPTGTNVMDLVVAIVDS